MVEPVPCEHPGQDLPCQFAAAADCVGEAVVTGDGEHITLGLNLGGADEGPLFWALTGHRLGGAHLQWSYRRDWGLLLCASGADLVSRLHLDGRGNFQQSVN